MGVRMAGHSGRILPAGLQKPGLPKADLGDVPTLRNTQTLPTTRYYSSRDSFHSYLQMDTRQAQAIPGRNASKLSMVIEHNSSAVQSCS